MRNLLLGLAVLALFSCDKEKCYVCTQVVSAESNVPVKGIPYTRSSKYYVCGTVRNPDDIAEYKTTYYSATGDTVIVHTLRKQYTLR